MMTWTCIFAAMALSAAPFAFAGIVRPPTEHTAFLLMSIFAMLAIGTALWTVARRVSLRAPAARHR